MQVAAASIERNTNVATTSVELPMSRFWKKASAITPATDPPIKKYRMRFIDLLGLARTCSQSATMRDVSYGAAGVKGAFWVA